MFNRVLGSPLVRVTVRYGAIAGVLCVVFVVSLYYMGKHPFLINPFLDFRVLLFAILIFFSLKEVRDFYQEGILYFWQGTGGSLFFLGTASLVAVSGILVFGSLQPAFLSDYINQFTEQIRTLPQETVEQIGKDVLDQNLKMLPTTTLASLAVLYAWQSFVIGFFISVIISVILRRQPNGLPG